MPWLRPRLPPGNHARGHHRALREILHVTPGRTRKPRTDGETMTPVLLIDFGSTYTKVTAIDLDRELLLGTAASYTTVETDVTEGLANALALLEAKTGPLTFAHRYACSSAAGGLRMMASGLVPELTAPGRPGRPAWGPEPKVLKTYSFQLTEDDAEEIAALKPDIFLLVGGTDGGNTECILHNAQVLAEVGGEFPIVVAGNRTASRQCPADSRRPGGSPVRKRHAQVRRAEH